MGWIWTGILLLSTISALQNGQAAALSAAVQEGASQGITLALALAGPLCLWSGLGALLSGSGVSQRLANLAAPLLQRLFPDSWKDPEAREALCGNLSANLLGLGNAATPLGIRAAKSMAAHADGTASDELCRLVVLNTASIQLLPTTVAAIRAGLGCSRPFDILPAVWLTSACSVMIGLLAAKGLSQWVR